MSEYFDLALRYRAAGPQNPLVRKVAVRKMVQLGEKTSSQSLKKAVRRFISEAGADRSPAL